MNGWHLFSVKDFLSGFYWVFVVEKVFFSGRNALEESFRAFGEASKKTGQVSASVQGGASPCPGLCRESPLVYIAFSPWERSSTHGKIRKDPKTGPPRKWAEKKKPGRVISRVLFAFALRSFI